MEPIAKLDYIQIDCKDPMAQVAFWSALLGYEPNPEVLGDPPHYAGLLAPPGHPEISFQRVPEGKTIKNRIHLDVRTGNLEQAIARIEEIGGEPLEPEHRSEYGYSYRRMLDPEGNEFCLILDPDYDAGKDGPPGAPQAG